MKPPVPFIAPLEWDAGDFTIRVYRPGDGAALAASTLASYEHLRPWMPWATLDYPVEEAEARVRGFAARYFTNEDFVLGIWRDGELLGGTGFHLRAGPLESKNAEIGMWINGTQANQGLGTKVLIAMLEWGFTEWGWERLVWLCDIRNAASARVAEKAGLTREGTLRRHLRDVDGVRRDTYSFGILREEWSACR